MADNITLEFSQSPFLENQGGQSITLDIGAGTGAPGADGADGADGRTPTRYSHGTVSTGTEDFSAAYTHHTITTAGSHTWTFSNFSEDQPEISIKLIVSSGTPTISLPGAATIATDSAQTLSTMVSGTYLVEVVSFDGGTSYEVLAAQVS